MAIYGAALLSACTLAGLWIGDLLGRLFGIGSNVGGVGISMILLIVVSDQIRRRRGLNAVTQQGVLFWSAIYIPVVVAMAACQDVASAIQGGPAALAAAAAAVAVSFPLVPLISRIGRNGSDDDAAYPLKGR